MRQLISYLFDQLSQLRPITHRGVGAFVEEDFSKTPSYLQQPSIPEIVNSIPNDDDGGGKA